MTLIALIIKAVVFDKGLFSITTPNVEVFLCRFICSVLLHMELIEDVKQGLNMMHFLNTYPNKFRRTSIPFLIACMQTAGGFLAECTNLFMLSSRSTTQDCITFFVAFHVLTAIDNIYAESVSSLELLEAVEDPLVYEDLQPKPFLRRTTPHKAIRVLWSVLNFLYNSVYYYFTPFFVNFVPYFFVAPVAQDTKH